MSSWRLLIITSFELLNSLPFSSSLNIVIWRSADHICIHLLHHLFSEQIFEKTMAEHNLWFPPELNVIKINVHGIIAVEANNQGNLNSVGIVARNHTGEFQWGVMGPIRDMGGLQSQVWAIHMAMKLQVKYNIPHTHIETDNGEAFDILSTQEDEVLEAEDLVVAAQQVNVLYAELNRVFEDGSQPRSCKITSIFSTRNRAPWFLTEYGFNHCSGLVEVPHPFGQLCEILDLENGLGPHLPAFEIARNFGLGVVSNPTSPPIQDSNGFMQISVSHYNMLLEAALNVDAIIPPPAPGHLVLDNSNHATDTTMLDNLNPASFEVLSNGLFDVSPLHPVATELPVWPPVSQGIVIKEPAFSQASSQTVAHSIGMLDKGKEKVQDGPLVSSGSSSIFEVDNSSNPNQMFNQAGDFCFFD